MQKNSVEIDSSHGYTKRLKEPVQPVKPAPDPFFLLTQPGLDIKFVNQLQCKINLIYFLHVVLP